MSNGDIGDKPIDSAGSLANTSFAVIKDDGSVLTVSYEIVSNTLVGHTGGGTSNQLLKKNSNTNYDTGWISQGSGGGLDADTVDGVHLVSLAQLTGAAFTGNVSSNSIISSPRLHVLDGGTISSVITSSVVNGNSQDSISHGFRNLNGTITYATISATGLFVNGSITINGAAGQTPLKSYHDVAYTGIYKGATLSSNEAVYFGSGAILQSIAGVNITSVTATGLAVAGNTSISGLVSVTGAGGFNIGTLGGSPRIDYAGSAFNFYTGVGASASVTMGALTSGSITTTGLNVTGNATITGGNLYIAANPATGAGLRIHHNALDAYFDTDGVYYFRGPTGEPLYASIASTGIVAAVNININKPTGATSLLNFSADGGTKIGSVGVDAAGNMVIRNNSAGAAYVDSYDGNVFFRNVSNGYANCGVLSQTSFAHPGNIYANAEFRLNNGATFSRVAKLDSGGGWGGGYNFIWNTNSTATHDSTGTIAGIAFNTNGSVRIYAGASANAATVATQMVTIDSAQSNFQKTVSITGVAGGQNSTLSLYNPVGVSYSIIDWWSEGAQVGQLISAPGSVMYYSLNTHVFRNFAATNQYAQINATGLTVNGSVTAVGTATFNGATAHAQLNSRGNTAIYSTNAANTTVTLGAQAFLGDTNFNNGSFYNSAPGIGSVYDSGTGVGGGLGVFIYNGVGGARSKVAEFTISGATIGTPALPNTITLTNTGITTFPDGQVRIGATSFSGAVPKLGVKMASADWAAQFEAHTAVGQSFGLRVIAGTSASDRCLTLANASVSELFVVKGDGEVTSVGNIIAPRHISTAQEGFRLADNAGPYLSFYNLAQTTRYGYIQHATTSLTIANEVATTGHINFITNGGNITFNNNPVWHAGNDGAGSGLDADLIDGYNSTSLFRDNSTSFLFRGDATVGYVRFNQGTNIYTGYVEFYNSAGTRHAYIGFARTDIVGPILFQSESGAGFQFDGGLATFNSQVRTIGFRDYSTLLSRFEGTGGGGVPAGSTGVGVEIAQDGTNGNVYAYNRSTVAYSPLRLYGSSVNLLPQSGSVNITGQLAVNGSGINSYFDSVVASDARMEFRYNGVRRGLIGWDSTIMQITTDNFPIVFFTNVTERARIAADGVFSIVGALTVGSSIKSTSPSGGVGYATGAGGTITQLTSKSTAVALNKVTGQITMHAQNLIAGGTLTFNLDNTSIAATDNIIVQLASGGSLQTYEIKIEAISLNQCKISVKNVSSADKAEAIVLNFSVIKGASS